MTTVSTSRRQGINSSAAVKLPCRAATTANITLSGEQTIDGVACVTGDRVLVKDQSTAANNGIYEVDTSTWTRSPDFDGTYDVVTGTLIGVTSGTVSANYFYNVTTTGTITIGTTSLAFALASLTPLVQSAAAFTPAVSGGTSAGAGTYSVQAGFYVKTGRQVHVQIYLNWSAHTGTGTLTITGLPFAAGAGTNRHGSVDIGQAENIATTASNIISGTITDGTTVIDINQYPIGGGSVTAVTLDTSGYLILSADYIAAS